MTTEIKQIMNELKGMRADLDFIKQNMPEKDMFLTSEEKKLLDESFGNEKAGKLVSADKLLKELE